LNSAVLPFALTVAIDRSSDAPVLNRNRRIVVASFLSCSTAFLTEINGLQWFAVAHLEPATEQYMNTMIDAILIFR